MSGPLKALWWRAGAHQSCLISDYFKEGKREGYTLQVCVCNYACFNHPSSPPLFSLPSFNLSLSSLSLPPTTFYPIVSSPVELLIMQALCWVHDDLNQVDIGSYVLKVCGQEEVLQK